MFDSQIFFTLFLSWFSLFYEIIFEISEEYMQNM